MTKLLYSVEEGAAMLGLGRTRMFEKIDSGEIESVKIGRSRRIPAEALEDYVARLRGQHGTDAAA